MNFPLYIARRYLLAKKSQGAVNILTLVAVLGVSIGTMALVVILSVFNGFEKLILSLFNSFNPDIEIKVAEGKTFSIDELPIEEIKKLPGVLHISEVLEETALLTYNERQHIVKLRGVDDNYRLITGIDTMIREGNYVLRDGDLEQLILGLGVAIMLDANLYDYLNPLVIYLPRRGRITTMNPAQAFSSSSNYASGVFSVQSEFDMDYVIAPISLLRHLTQHHNQVTSVMISVDKTANLRNLQKELTTLVGDSYVVRNRLQQEEFLYKVMRSEKWAIFFILSFILVIAAFNITGSLTMLVLEKRKDIRILWSMGCSVQRIKTIFLYEGLLISTAGAVMGLSLGAIVGWVQMKYGLVALQADGTFIIEAYPLHLNIWDFPLVFFTVSLIGGFASFLPLLKIKTFLEA